MKTLPIESDYLEPVYKTKIFKKIINVVATDLKKLLTKKSTKFDAIAFTGTSGAALAYPLSYKLGIPLICIRKGSDYHAFTAVEGYTRAKTCIIIDDLISTGSTVDTIHSRLEKYTSAKIIGIYLMRTDGRKFYKLPNSSKVPVYKNSVGKLWNRNE